MSTEKAPSGEESTETVRQGTAGTVGELATQNQTGGTAGQTGSGTGTAGQTLPTATAGSSMTATSSKKFFFNMFYIFEYIYFKVQAVLLIQVDQVPMSTHNHKHYK
jgi:hypothetical protein